MRKAKTWAALAVALACTLVFASCSSAAQSAAAPASQAAAIAESTAPASSESTTLVTAPTGGANATGYDAIPTPEIPEGTVIKVGYLALNETHQFCVMMGDALRDEASKYGDAVQLEVADARSSIATQISQAEDMVVKDVDVIILHPIDQDASAPALEIVVNAGIPLITVNTLTVNKDIATTYVGVDDVEAGVQVVKMMSEALGGTGVINIMEGMLGDPANETRMHGIEQELANHPGLTINARQAADWDRGRAMSLAEDWLAGGQAFDGIIAMNDEMGVSAALTMASANKADIKIVGVDGIDEAFEFIKSGQLYGTAYQPTDPQGRGAMKAALCAALGVELEKEYIIPFEPVTAENVDGYLS